MKDLNTANVVEVDAPDGLVVGMAIPAGIGGDFTKDAGWQPTYVPHNGFDLANRNLGLGIYAPKPKSPEPYLWHTMLQDYITNETKVCIHLSNGVRLEGIINLQDAEALTLVRDGTEQLVMKHAVGTVMPVGGK